MSDAPRTDRLSRDEMGRLQRKALREWRESDWLATHDPAMWTKLGEVDPARICVDLGSGHGEAAQYPGYIGLDVEYGDRRALQEKGEDRIADLQWNLNDGLPFEDGAVDDVYARDLLGELSALALSKLPKELARVVTTTGCVELVDQAPLVRKLGDALEAYGFEQDSLAQDATKKSRLVGRYVLTAQRRSLEDVAPHRIDEIVMGEHVIREPRAPYRR